MAVLAVALVLTAAALAGEAPVAQLLGRAPRYEGAITLVVLIAAAAAGARLFGPGVDRTATATSGARTLTHPLRAYLQGTTVMVTMLAVIAILESFGLRPISTNLSRPGSLAGNATDQGILGLIAVAVLGAIVVTGIDLRRAPADLPRAWPGCGVVAGIIAVATSNSRGAILGLGVVTVGLILIAVLGARSRRRAVGWTVAAGALSAGLILAVPLTRDRLFGGAEFAQQTVGDRVIMWGDAGRLFLTAPVLGVGPNGFMDAVTPLFGDGWYTRAQVGSILDSPHNIVIQAAVAGGSLGLAAAGVLMVGGLIAGSRRIHAASAHRRGILFGSMLALLGAGITLLTHVTSPVTLLPLAVLFGILVSAPPRMPPAHPPLPSARAGRLAVVWALSTWMVFVSLCAVADIHLETGREQAARGELPRAEASFRLARTLRPWDPDIAILAAQGLGAAEEHGVAGGADLAESWAQEATRMVPSSSTAQFIAGMVAMLRYDAAAADQRLTKAVELMPADPRAHHELGLLRMVTGDLEGARSSFERALVLDPSSDPTARALAQVCAKLGDPSCDTK